LGIEIFSLLLGFGSGLALGFWQLYRLNRQLRSLLKALPDTPDVARSLSIVSLVRREIHYLLEQSQHCQRDWEIQQNLLAEAPIGYLRIDRDNHLCECNLMAQRLLNINRWQGDQLRLVLELVRSYELDQLIELTRHHQAPQAQEWIFYPAPDAIEGPLPSLTLSSQALRGYGFPLADQEVAIFLEDLQPLTDLTRHRDRAFADLTHELRTPLTAMALVTEMLEQRLSSPEAQWVSQMRGEISRLQHLVEDWLTLAELRELPGQLLHYQTVELGELIHRSWQTLAPLTQAQQIRWIYQAPEQTPLHADRDRLLQVWLNLLDNSIKHSPVQGSITVTVTPQDSGYQIDLRDQGEGFNPADLPHVFERLYRGEASRTRQGRQKARQGSGLGLAIAKEIIEAHGGTITARNASQAGGAWITVFLPQEPPSPDPPETQG